MGKEVVDVETVQREFGKLMRQNLMMDCIWGCRVRTGGDKEGERESACVLAFWLQVCMADSVTWR